MRGGRFRGRGSLRSSGRTHPILPRPRRQGSPSQPRKASIVIRNNRTIKRRPSSPQLRAAPSIRTASNETGRAAGSENPALARAGFLGAVSTGPTSNTAPSIPAVTERSSPSRDQAEVARMRLDPDAGPNERCMTGPSNTSEPCSKVSSTAPSTCLQRWSGPPSSPKTTTTAPTSTTWWGWSFQRAPLTG